MKDQGITLIELIVVMAIIGILSAVLGYQYDTWIRKYVVKKIVKDLYMDMMYARMMAITCSREHYIVLGDRSYSIVEDTNNSGNTLTFEKRGLMPKWRTIRVTEADGILIVLRYPWEGSLWDSMTARSVVRNKNRKLYTRHETKASLSVRADLKTH